MKERKNLENIFQEKFENFNVLPPESAWTNIEMRLKEKKKRRVIPFWWKMSGIAASLILGLFIISLILKSNLKNSTINTENSIVNGKTTKKLDSKLDENQIVKSNATIDATLNNNKVRTINSNLIDESISNSNKKQIVIKVENDVKLPSTNQTNSNLQKFKSNKKYENFNTNAVAESNKFKIKSNKSKLEKENTIKINNNNNQLASKDNLNTKQDSSRNNYVTNQLKSDYKVNDKLNSEKLFKENNSNVVSNNSKFKNEINTKSIVLENAIKENNSITSEKNIKIIEEIKKIDSTKIAIVEPNALEELLKEKEKKTSKEPKLNRWQLVTNVAPIYFSSTGSNGSPLDSKLANNQKSYETNLSYGLGVNYALTKRLKVRTGINTVSFDYNTNDLTFYQTNNASKLSNLNVNENGLLIQIETKSVQQGLPEINDFGFSSKKYDSSLNQKLGYIEVPMEMSYTVVNKKFGVELLGGFSTLFLNQNQVYLESAGVKMEIGQANNLNAFHFSGNLGLGLKYAILKRISVKVEPVIKYQLNTFSTDTGSFKPYILGIYSGLSYTF